MARGDLTRWERAIELDPTYAPALNNLAVAYEHEGQLDKARKAYERALEIEPNNLQIRQNYELFKEINDRTGAEKDKP
ncbi:MAG: tetratricopeptide repeat protein [Vicinamibacterales bacterium]